MKITINKSILIQALGIITPITDKSSSKPILSNFLLTADSGGEVIFSATDYEIYIKSRFPAEVAEAGSVCISAKRALEVCREFITEDVVITAGESGQVTLEGGSARLRLSSVEVGLYPAMEMPELKNSFSMKGNDLKRCIDLTLFAAQVSEVRKNLMGVCLQFPESGKIKWTATDGHRLAQVMQQVEGGSSEKEGEVPEIIIPRKSLLEIQKVVDGSEEAVKIDFDERMMVLTAPQVVLNTRLIEGKFPNVEQVIPKDSDKTILVNTERLSNGLKIIALMSNEKIKPVKFTLKEGSIGMESERADYGDAADQLEVDYKGEEMQIGFNAQYLLEVLGVIKNHDVVQLQMKGALNPCLITIPDNDSFLSVVMPLRIEW